MIRNATLMDIPAIAALLSASMPSPWREADIGDVFDMPAADILIWADADCIAGVLIYSLCAEEAEILELCVLPSQRRQGIATSLFFSMLDRMMSGTDVFLEVRAGNAGAIALYEKLGFTKIGIRKNYYSAPPEDAFVMKLEKF